MRVLIAITLLAAFSGCNPAPQPAIADAFETWSTTQKIQSDFQVFKQFLEQNDVSGIIRSDQLLRSDVRWKKCKSARFIIPPRSDWSNMVPTLKLVREKIIPLVGPVEALSVYRDPKINKCIGGASHSYHLQFFAIDMQPLDNISRYDLIAKLCAFHKIYGKKYKIGLGIYKAKRFHIDTAGYRTWGPNYRASSSPCLSNVAAQHQTG